MDVNHPIHPSVHPFFSHLFNSGAGAYPSCRTARGMVPSGQIANLLQGTAMNESSLPSRIISFCFYCNRQLSFEVNVSVGRMFHVRVVMDVLETPYRAVTLV